ncbi:RHS repeat-associated core domain-containing protein [Streptacidiphilus fuscans]|uniref:RHS domain-containing protein n=1 Tax=Streptacidiphilus fuscans TaxID=2789292 RepID=A0A931FE84_9ACTN|nr:RHS repeat-associated core domain-containing protein [Streptacidiphilus fuscans]MBF9070398.1 RHS domain-containing protein [Streptacidiphilus fuscans]
MSQIAKAIAEAAQKAGKSLAEDFAKAYHSILKDTERGAKTVSENAAKNEAETAENLAKSAEKDANSPHVHAPGEGGAAGGRDGGNPRGEHPGGDDPNLGGEEPRPGQPSEGNVGCHTAGDPVDVVTGQMITTAVDLRLEGALPLALRRAYASGYIGGRWYGPGWSGTLDERVQVDTDGIWFAGDDAQILHYPLPADNVSSVLPLRGAKWPLSWDGPDGTIRIESPDTGLVRHFDPVPGTPDASTRPLSTVTDRNGNRYDHLYSRDGLPVEIRHSGGYRIAVDTVHTPAGTRIAGLRLLDGTDAGRGSRVVAYTWDDSGRLSGVVNSSGMTLTYDWDEDDRITSWTDRIGHSYTYEYGRDGRVVCGRGTEGVLDAWFSYDIAGRATTVTDSLGHATRFSYDEDGHVTRVVDPLGHETLTGYDESGHVVSRTDEIGRTTRYMVDEQGTPVRITAEGGRTIELSYNSLGLLTGVVQAGVSTGTFAYDDRGNLISSTDVAGAVTTRQFDAHGRLAAVTDPLGHTRTFEYNAAGLATAVSDPDGNTARVDYDAFGRTVALTDASGSTLRLERNAQGDVTRRIHPDGAAEEWIYDAEGNVVEYRDQIGAVTHFEIGPFGRLDARRLPDGELHLFRYDSELQLIAAGAGESWWTYQYDAGGNLVTETDLNGRSLTYVNDGAHQLLATIGPDGATTAFRYDDSGNLTGRQDSDGLTALEYDDLGRVQRVSRGSDQIIYSRDIAGRVLSETANGRTTAYTYDVIGRRVSRTTPSGIVSHWTYDANSEPLTLTGSGGRITFERDAVGRETRRRFGASAVLAQTWDACHRLNAQTVLALPSSTEAGPNDGLQGYNVQERLYSYRADGILLAADDRMRGRREFDLTPGGRITGVRGETWTESYRYDQLGNLTHTHDSRRADAAAQGERQVSGSLLSSAGRTTYEYDARGRVVRAVARTLSGRRRAWSYTWNAQDQLVRVDTPGHGSWLYAYDPVGRRTLKRRADAPAGSTEETRYSWDGDNLAEESTVLADGSLRIRSWDWDLEGLTPLAQTEHRSLYNHGGDRDSGLTEADASFWAIVSDLVGTPSELISADGTIAWASSADVWGRPLRPARDDVHCPLGMPGQYHDDETGLAYNYFRYYDPATGRYLSGDPLGQAADFNPHSYVPNPLYWIDPLGLAKKQPSGMGGWYYKLQPANWSDGSNSTRYEINHVPAKATYKSLGMAGGDLNMGYGPAIRMEYQHHRDFISTGSGPGPDRWRAAQSSLIRQGKFDEAMKMDIDEIRRVHGTKYDAAIKEMRESIQNNVEFKKYLDANGWKFRTCLLE